MGILVHDAAEVPNYGITVRDFSITCKGCYSIEKIAASYVVRSTCYWFAANAVQPLYLEQFSFILQENELMTVPNMFNEIYARLKARYQNVEDN